MISLVNKSVAALLIALFVPSLQAATVYKYKDANGRWVITDKPPQGKAVETVEQQRLVYTEKSPTVSVVNRGSKQRPVLYALNQTGGPVQVWLEFYVQENLRLSQEAPFEWVIPPFTEQFVLQMEAAEPNKTWAYEWSYRFVPGEPVNTAQLGTPEIGLPFRGGPFPVTQSFYGEASHKHYVEAHYAVDIAMPDGTPIVAVDDGVVTEVERDFSRSGWSEEYADEANYVRVRHSNGAISVYAHLAADKVEVVPGQTVRRGQLLAYSGNTGFSTGPHLHFVMQANGGKKLQSIPFRFRGHHAPPVAGERLENHQKD
jgi:murein DD-endopeptidase MepM/ murein hydrolase activator NlpD